MQEVRLTTVRRITFALVAMVLFIVLPVSSVQAQALNAGISEFNQSGSGLASGNLVAIISRVINIALGFLSIVAVSIILYGGFRYMTANGVEENVQKAKKTITQAVIGLVIILLSWAIAAFIINTVSGATGVTSAPTTTGSQSSFTVSDLGNGYIKEHFPVRGATGVPRNTPIMITFKGPIKPETIFDANGLKTANIKIIPANGTAVPASDVVVTKTDDNTTFVIRPTQAKPFGSAQTSTMYKVTLTSGIQKADGTAALRNPTYDWSFEVSTVLDLTPPKIISILPEGDDVNVPKNALIQVIFDEAIDPVAMGLANTVRIDDVSSGNVVAGQAKLGGGYKVMEFVPSEVCGTNSCGSTIYCLPAGNGTDQNIKVTIKAASIDATLGAPTAARTSGGMVDGVTDVVGNSLDGSGDGVAKGSPDDDRQWTFATSSAVRAIAPKLLQLTPGAGTSNVSPTADVGAEFDTVMSILTLSSENLPLLSGSGGAVPYWVDQAMLQGPKRTQAIIKHDPFLANSSYQPQITSSLKDVYQNCLTPIVGPECSTTTLLPNCCLTTSGSVVPQKDGCTPP